MGRCHAVSGKASTEQHYRHNWCEWFHLGTRVLCWQSYDTHFHCKEEWRNKRDIEYHSLRLITVQSRMKSRDRYHCNKDHWLYHASCPVVIYFKKDGVLHHISLCIISDDLEYDTCFVEELLRIVMLYVKENLLQIKSVDYFSDSCAGQYKNCKAFLNRCHPKSDLDIDVTWGFFATSHGKSPCDGIGGT